MPLILPSNSISAVGYEVDNSLRFDKNSSDTLTRTPSSAGNRKTFTFSCWIKRGAKIGQFEWFFSANNTTKFAFNGNNMNIFHGSSIVLNRVFRDPSAWYHIVIAYDTTQATDSNRVKIYINGEQETSFSEASYPSQNADLDVNNTVVHYIGESGNPSFPEYNDGYKAETVLIDGQQLDPTSFGKFDEATGIWKPIDVSGLTFGTNGFYLDFENSGSLGADVSGNGNNFTENNLTSIDQSTDTCTNNFATLNPLHQNSSAQTFSEGNLKVTSGGSGDWASHYGASTIAVDSGKWFVETKLTTKVTSHAILGLVSTSQNITSSLKDNGLVAVEASGRITGGGINIQTGLASWSNGDIAGLAYDADNGTAQFYRNGSAYGSQVTSLASGEYYFATNSFETGAVVEFNFGSPPYSESGGNSDGDGYGNFSMAVPSGYFALNTKNLAEYG